MERRGGHYAASRLRTGPSPGTKHRNLGLDLIDLVLQFGQAFGGLVAVRRNSRCAAASIAFVRSSFSSRDCNSFLLGFIAGDWELVLAAPFPVLLARGLAAAFLTTEPRVPRAMRAFRGTAAFTVPFFAGRAIPVLPCR
jgi:hypothetical protein